MNDAKPITCIQKPAENEAEFSWIQAQLMQLLADQAIKYTSGESSSIPIDVAQELFASVCYTLHLDADGIFPAEINRLKPDLQALFGTGQREIREKVQNTHKLWNAAATELPQIENRSLFDTVNSIGTFFRRYDTLFFAHQIPCDIDYQLSLPVPDRLQGVDYIAAYLTHLRAENKLIRAFAPAGCVCVLTRYCPDYRGLLINLCEPVLTQAIGCVLAGVPCARLDISQRMRNRIADKYAFSVPSVQKQALIEASDEVCRQMGIEVQTRVYARRVAAALHPRFHTAMLHGGLDGLFLTV